MNDAIKESAKLNPSTTGEFEWILVPSREEWNCECAEYAAHGPYKADELPEIPAHPNCVCQIRPVLKKWEDFKKELLESDGNNLPDLDEWISGGATSNPESTSIFSGIGSLIVKGAIGVTASTFGAVSTIEDDNHIVRSNPDLKEVFTSDGNLKDFNDIGETKAKEAIEKMTGWGGAKQLKGKQVENLYMSIKETTKRMSELLNSKGSFIDLKSFITNVKQADSQTESNVYAVFNLRTKEMSFGGVNIEEWWERYKDDVKSGFHPKNTNGYAIIIHEIGHALSAENYNATDEIANKVYEKFKYRFKSLQDMRISVSRYSNEFRGNDGKTVVHKNNREFFAECFADYIQNGERANIVSKEFIKIWLKEVWQKRN